MMSVDDATSEDLLRRAGEGDQEADDADHDDQLEKCEATPSPHFSPPLYCGRASPYSGARICAPSRRNVVRNAD